MNSPIMFCGACGKGLAGSVKFCVFCGATIEPQAPSSPTAMPPPLTAQNIQAPTKVSKKVDRRGRRVIVFLFLVFAIVAIVANIPSPSSKTQQVGASTYGNAPQDAKNVAAETPPTKSEEPTDVVPDLMDAKALDDKYEFEASAHCSTEADDYLRSVAKYDFKWDDVGWLGSKFDKYLKKVPSPGVVILVSDKVMLQNGFGAFHRVELFCSYDTQAKKVDGYTVRDNGND